MTENIYANAKPINPVAKAPDEILGGFKNSKKSLCLGVVFPWLLNVLLVVGIIGFAVHSQQNRNLAADVSTKLISMTEERDRLNATLTNMTKELNKFRQMEGCPTGWVKSNGSCYLVSGCGSWDEGNNDCKNRGGHLVVINSKDEQAFVATYVENSVWIGLNDKETEGSWKWVDGTSPNLQFWEKNQPDNGGTDQGHQEEDCAHIRSDEYWNDLPCAKTQPWICEKATTSTS